MISNKYINTIIVSILVIAITFTAFVVLIPKTSENLTIEQPEYIDKAFDKDKITNVDIEISDENWQIILDDPTAEEYVTANITINGEKYNNVGIRAKGNSSLSSIAQDDTTDRYSFKIKFDEYVKGQTYYGLDKLVLNNNYSDTTNMKEYLSYDLLTQMDIATPAFAYSEVKMNGEYFGLYLAVEVIEESFLERNYGTSEGNLYKPEGMDLAGGNMANGMGNKNENAPDGTTGASTNTNEQVPQNNGERPEMPSGDGQAPDGNGQMPSENGQLPEGNGQMPQMPSENGQLPESNGQMPQMPSENGQLPEGNGQMPQMPSENGQLPEGNGQMPQMPSQDEQTAGDNTTTNQEKPDGNLGGMGMGMGSKGGTNLVWVDEDLSNYSTVLDSAVFKTTDDTDKQKLIDMIKNLNQGTNLEEYINVDEVLRYFAVNTFLVNLDSYASNMKHNYYLYEKDGIFEILPWDYNMSFAGFQSGDATSVINFPIDSPVTDTVGNSPLIEKLLEVPEYKNLYHTYLQEIVDYVNNGTFENTINSVDTLISDYVKNDPTAFFTYDEYTTSIPELITFGTDRATSITAQLDGSQPSTTYGTIDTTLNLNALGTMGGAGGKNYINGNDNNPIGNTNSPVSNANGNMPDKELMMQAMQIVQNSNNEFTEDVISQLKELGLDDNFIEMLKNGPTGQANGVNKPTNSEINNIVPTPGESNDDINLKNSVNADLPLLLVLYSISILVLVAGIVYVFKFSNKKYISK